MSRARAPRRRWHSWLSATVVLLLASVGLVLWARTRPSFDAYGWLVWGHQTLAGSLNTNAAPSWKPLPYVFTVPYAAFGRSQLWLWMITVVAISLAGAIFAGRIAYRLSVGEATTNRWPGVLAGLFAAASLLAMGAGSEADQGWWHYMLSAQSDTMIVALCLAGVDAHLSGRPRWAFALGALASLGRPEVWPLEALYAIWAWRAVPSMRRMIVVGVVAILLLWFGIPALSSRSPFVAASNAFGSGRRLRSNQVLGTVRRFLALEPAPVELAALVSLCWGALRRDWTVLALGAAVLLWVLVEIAFALHGWPGLGRYMFGAAGLMVVLAAILVGRLLIDVTPLARRYARSPTIVRASGWAGATLAVALLAVAVPTVVSRARGERRDLRVQRQRTAEISRLGAVIDRLGGPARLRSCGEPLTHLEYQTVLAWTLRVNVAAVGYKYAKALRHHNPVVFFTPLPAGGWDVHALRQRQPSCLGLPG